MQTKSIIHHGLQALAACFGAAVLSLGLSGCSDKEIDSPDTPGGSGQRGELVGTWYGSYSQRGEITNASPGSRTGYYVNAVQGLKFNADGTGTCYQYLCDVAGDPLSIFGGSMDQQNGQFHYTVKDDSIVTIVRDGEGDALHPKTWQVINGWNGLRGINGTTEYNLQTATDEQKGYLSQWEELLRAGNNAETGKGPFFLDDWEHCETVNLSKYGMRNLPWYGAADNDIPEAIRFDMKKENGWEMAFCMLNDEYAPSVHMFGLYNKLTGTLRVWQYIESGVGYGKELFFNLVNDSRSTNRYPFYNSMAYAIPVNRTWGGNGDDPLQLKANAELITNGNHYKPFESLVSAYTRTGEAKGVSPNWHCADIDLSGYMPMDQSGVSAKKWRVSVDADNSLFNISLASQSVSEVSLAGKLFGDISGEYTASMVHGSSCANPALAMATNIIGNAAGFLNTSFSNLNCLCGVKKNGKNVFWPENEQQGGDQPGDVQPPVNPEQHDDEGDGEGANEGDGGANQIVQAPRRSITFFGVMAGLAGLLNIATATLKSWPNSQAAVDSTAGNINLALNAKLSLDGLITQWTGLPDGGITITPLLLNASNKNSSIGTGCFGLKEDPVIYVCKEDFLCNTERISVTMKDDGTMYSTDIDKKDLRMVAFLDPTSIKFYLNTDVYHDIKELTLTAVPVVDLYRPVGNTDSYLRFLKLPERPTIKLKKAMNNTNSKPRLHNFTHEQALAGDKWTAALQDSVKLVEQTGNDGRRYYGASAALWGRNCMIDPQIYIPYNGSQVYHMTVPDYYVNIVVNFKCSEAPLGVEICKQYMPRYVLLSRAELAAKYKELKEYADKCDKEEAVGTLENDKNITFINYSGGKFLKKTLNILKIITDDAAKNP